GRLGLPETSAKVVAVVLVGLFVVVALALLAFAVIPGLTNGPESVVFLLRKMAEIVDTARNRVPEWLGDYLPSNIEEVEALVSSWLRDHAWQLQLWGREIGKVLVQ